MEEDRVAVLRGQLIRSACTSSTWASFSSSVNAGGDSTEPPCTMVKKSGLSPPGLAAAADKTIAHKLAAGGAAVLLLATTFLASQ